MKDLAVFGIGRMGYSIAINYSQKGGKVIAIDNEQEKIDEIADYVTYAVRADATDENVIKSIGIDNVDVAVIAMGQNFEASIIATTVCKEMGIPYVIAKAKSKLQGDVLKKIGADEILYPENEVGIRIANKLAHSDNFQEVAELQDNYEIIKTRVPSKWEGKSIRQLALRQKYGFNIIAISKENVFDINLNIDKPFDGSEEIMVIGEAKQLAKAFGK